MRRYARTAVGATMAAAAAFGTCLAGAQPAGADVNDCVVYPEPPYGSVGGGGVTCPAGAGDFTFRAVVDCYDGYPNPSNPQFVGTYHGPWTATSATTETSSTVQCHGHVPGSGIGFNTRIEIR